MRKNEIMRGLFLDFDGVTHPVSAIADWRTLNVHGADIAHLIEKRDLFRWLPQLTSALEDHPDVLLVIHSGWRAVADNVRMRQILGPSLSERFIGVTSVDLDRHQGIKEFALRSGMDQYLIVDDATSEFPRNHEHLLATDPELGLSDTAVEQRLRDWLASTSPTQTAVMSRSMVG